MAAEGKTAFVANDRVAYRLRFAIYVAFLVLCWLGGGGSRADILSLLYVRPAAILALGAILIVRAPIDFRSIKVPLYLLIGLTVWIALQLVPLPPSIWTSLAGREPISAGAAALGIDQPWRPLSMSPDLTLDSLAAMVVPFAGLIGFAALDEGGRRALLPILIGAAIVSALLGIVQISGGPANFFYFYRVTNEEAAVGLFANRNHEAALLALTFPMLAVWAASGEADSATRQRKAYAAIVVGAFMVPMILVTGSRAGLVLGLFAATWACFHYASEVRGGTGRGIGWQAPALAMLAVLALGGLFVFLASGRAVALQRLLGAEESELRLSNLPTLFEMARSLFPWGSGFGTFDPVYRIYEPYQALSPRYLNQAHNDLLELVITGGLPAVILLLLLLSWWSHSAWRLLGSWRRHSRRESYGRLGAMMILLLLFASLVDYPLRIPIMGLIFAIACGWVGSANQLERTN